MAGCGSRAEVSNERTQVHEEETLAQKLTREYGETLGVVDPAPTWQPGVRPLVFLTALAEAEIVEIAKQQGLANWRIRLAPKLEEFRLKYLFQLDVDPPRPDDVQMTCGRVTVLIAREDIEGICGMEIDFYVSPDVRGFAFGTHRLTAEDLDAHARWADIQFARQPDPQTAKAPPDGS